MKRNIIGTVIALFMSMFIVSAQESEKNDEVSFVTYTAKEFKENYKLGDILVDVRTPEEYNEGHIIGALLMNINTPDFNEKIKTLKKENNVFVYCAAGIRSKTAAAVLSNSGFHSIYNLKGGYKDLVKAGMLGTK